MKIIIDSRVQDSIKGRKLTHAQANHLWYGPPGEPGFKHEMNQISDAHMIAYQRLYFETIEPAMVQNTFKDT